MPGKAKYVVEVNPSSTGTRVTVRLMGKRGWGWNDSGAAVIVLFLAGCLIWFGWQIVSKLGGRPAGADVWAAWVGYGSLYFMGACAFWVFVVQTMKETCTRQVTVDVSASRVELEQRWGLARERSSCAVEDVKRVLLMLPMLMSRTSLEKPVELRPAQVLLDLKNGVRLTVTQEHDRGAAVELAAALAQVIAHAQHAGADALEVADFCDAKNAPSSVMTPEKEGEEEEWCAEEIGNEARIYKPRSKGRWKVLLALPMFRMCLLAIVLPGPIMLGAIWLLPDAAAIGWKLLPLFVAIHWIWGLPGVMLLVASIYADQRFLITSAQLEYRYHGVFYWWTRRWDRARVEAISVRQSLGDKGFVRSQVEMTLADGKLVRLCRGDVMGMVRLAGLLRDVLAVPVMARAEVPISEELPEWHLQEDLEFPAASRWQMEVTQEGMTATREASGFNWSFWVTTGGMAALMIAAILGIALANPPLPEDYRAIACLCVFVLVLSGVLEALVVWDATLRLTLVLTQEELVFTTASSLGRNVKRFDVGSVRAVRSKAEIAGSQVGAKMHLILELEDGREELLMSGSGRDMRCLATHLRGWLGVGAVHEGAGTGKEDQKVS